MGLPAISIIIPVFNAGKYLSACLDSLALQTFDDYEVVAVDDGSTDSSASIITGYAGLDERIRLLQQENKGVSAARNAGIEAARGKYITFVDADDALHPEALASMYAALKSETSAVCITGFVKFSGDYRVDGIRVPRRKVKPESYSYIEAMKMALYQKRIFNSPWGMMMERRLLSPDKRFREDTRYEDLDAFYRMYEGLEKIIYLPFPYYFYRENEESFINTWSKSRLDVLDVTDRMAEFFSKKYPELERAARDRRYSAHFNMLVLLLRHDPRNNDMINRCLEVVKEQRLKALTDPNVRIKNKIGALASFGGQKVLRALGKGK